MKKSVFMTVCILLFSTVSMLKAQVGINTESPCATLDVMGKPTVPAIPDGVIPPRISGDRLKDKDDAYTATQMGAIIYITAPVTVASAKTVNVTTPGYYYFDGAVWQSFKGQSGGTSSWNVAGTANPASRNTQSIYQMGSVGIGTSNPSASAALEVASSGKGFLPPRVNLTSTADASTILSPTEGLLVYSQPFDQIQSNGSTQHFPEGIYMYDGTQWVTIISSNANNSGLPIRNSTGVLVQVNQSKYITLNGYQSFGLLLQNAGATIKPIYDLGNWSPTTQSAMDVISTDLGDNGAMLMEHKDSGIVTFWRLNFNYQLGNYPPAATRYFRVDIVDGETNGVVFSEAVVVPGGLDTGHTAPFSIFFATIADSNTNHRGYKIEFGVDTAASTGLPNNISVQLKQILKID